MKGHTSYDILPVCIDCHEKYEEKARDYRKNIIKELKILDEREDSPPIGKPDIIKIKGIKAASALSRHQNKMPIDRKQKLFNDLSLFLNKDINQITPEDIEQTIELSWKMFPDVSYSSSQKVVEKLTDIDDFARRWRLHFLEMTKPKHLPPHWIADKKLYNKNLDN
jgi:hypothetical protein